jgi:hypothetical protein
VDGRGPGTESGVRRASAALALLALLSLLFASGAEAKWVSFPAKRVRGQTVAFRVGGIRVVEVRGATVRAGRYRKTISQVVMRRAARRHGLRVRLPRRVARHLRRRPRLSVSYRPGAVWESTMSFEAGNFAEASSLQSRDGLLKIISSRAYDGAKSARAQWLGGSEGAQRVWKNTDWRPGTNVWYGMALFVPSSNHYCYWNPIRWDNYDLYGGQDDGRPGEGDVGGVSILHDQISVMRNTYGGDEQTLVHGGTLPKDRWAWLEVHQVLSPHDGRALSEVYVDGHRRGYSRRANSLGRRITSLRSGAVALATGCSSASNVDFDRVSISNSRRGPLR